MLSHDFNKLSILYISHDIECHCGDEFSLPHGNHSLGFINTHGKVQFLLPEVVVPLI